ncbi:hypothetical protein CVT24_003549 [Panaeolus cyanescens]|uniref:UV radiation resistance-associated gene protein n=1 Tax=Panaeolus cyanescens TaxID=181874 RepID=A0A409Y7J5_9AGAR|nr:hypothetical protein CVT24_003549 [Panaeolus cyanescens]
MTQRCIRHITSIQVRNLTPFPFRDAVTSALSQPPGQQFAGPSYSMDDFEAIQSRRRSRKHSSTSTVTRIHTVSREDDDLPTVKSEPRGRAVSFSRNIREHSPTNLPIGVGPQSYSSSRSVHSLRARRARTSSLTSTASLHRATSELGAPTILFQSSQRSLEKVIRSRLVETILAISIPTEPNDENETTPASPPRRALSTALRSAPTHQTTFQPRSPPKRNPSKPTATKDSERKIGKGKLSMTAGKKDFYDGLSSESHTNLPPANGSNNENNHSNITEGQIVYCSRTHRPSTNPIFSLDFTSNGTSSCAGATAHHFTVEIWGREPSHSTKENNQADHRPRPLDYSLQDDDWRKLDSWDIDLRRLIPVPEPPLEDPPIQLPSNTLVITLAPLGRAFYLPKIDSDSRPVSPSPGYTSDPETKTSHVHKLHEAPPSNTNIHSSNLHLEPSSATLRPLSKTAGWQDLFKLVTLQSCILDNENSLREIGSSISWILEQDRTYALKREISQREAFVKQLHEQKAQVLAESQKARLRIAERERDFARRREILKDAHGMAFFDEGLFNVIESERSRLLDFNKRMTSLRTSLINVLCTIFPIELYSPPDLLFTILNVPLPIPVSAQDPAPPLSMPDHKEVTEEGIATAYGYVAQILQLLSAYLGKSLVYPVTCIGSRSVIKDGISAMVGPRIFPLYSKGVDTYRFEYAVFLLNKNIEMLMADRDLRALDLRHTLPNLKNLLLTLSHGASTLSHSLPRPISISSLNSAVGTPERSVSPVGESSTTPKASQLGGRCNSSETLLPNEGTRTPTNAPEELKKGSRSAFLGFGPLSDFLRVRYPSSSTREGSVNGVEEANTNDGDSWEGQDEEDRKTIHGETNGSAT